MRPGGPSVEVSVETTEPLSVARSSSREPPSFWSSCIRRSQVILERRRGALPPPKQIRIDSNQELSASRPHNAASFPEGSEEWTRGNPLFRRGSGRYMAHWLFAFGSRFEQGRAKLRIEIECRDPNIRLPHSFLFTARYVMQVEQTSSHIRLLLVYRGIRIRNLRDT